MTHPVRAVVRAIQVYLPEARLTNQELAERFPEWTAATIAEKLGIEERRVSAPDEFSSVLGIKAAQALFDSGATTRDEIDYVIMCTQSPDYFLPATAFLLHKALGLSKQCGALDINLGCSGWIYGLGLAKGIVETGQAKRVLFVTADASSKLIHPGDQGVRMLFGDSGTATFISSDEESGSGGAIAGPFTYGSDGGGALSLYVPTGGTRQARDSSAPTIVEGGSERTINHVYMNGVEIVAFTLREVPPLVNRALEKAGYTVNDIDYFVFHQMNARILSHLQMKLRIPADRFTIDMADCGNTGSSTIPIALSRAIARGDVRPGMRVMLVGFGVGLSWGATFLEWA